MREPNVNVYPEKKMGNIGIIIIYLKEENNNEVNNRGRVQHTQLNVEPKNKTFPLITYDERES